MAAEVGGIGQNWGFAMIPRCGPEAHIITTTEGTAKHLPLWEIYAEAA